jgi:hypothetical protein
MSPARSYDNLHLKRIVKIRLLACTTHLKRTPPAKSRMWQEFKKMLSLQGFKDFWRDLRG